MRKYTGDKGDLFGGVRELSKVGEGTSRNRGGFEEDKMRTSQNI
jgi:hypothetical protein